MPELDFEVLFAMVPDATDQGSGFGVNFEWDIPLLDGYRHRTLDNVATRPSVTDFTGCDTPEIYQLLKAAAPDAVIVNGWVVKACVQALWACKRLGIPCLVRGEANDLRTRASWKRGLQGMLMRQYAAALYIGTANKSFYRARGVTEERLFPALYCVENERFERAASALSGQREAVRVDWAVAEDCTCYLYCGKFESKKHPLELLQAFREALRSNDRLHLLMVGDGVLKAECEHFVQQHNLPVTFAGFLNQTEIVRAYIAADCLVLPSDAGETWGLVVNEAMACGRPALVSDLAGCAYDLVEPGITGDIFSFGDWQGLADLLVRYGNERQWLVEMGRQAQQKIRDYSPVKAAEGILRAVSGVLSRRQGRAA